MKNRLTVLEKRKLALKNTKIDELSILKMFGDSRLFHVVFQKTILSTLRGGYI
jgi:hypothetical protein